MRVLGLSFSIAFLDQLTKHLIRARLDLGARIEVIPGFFDLRHIVNTGAAWGAFSGFNRWLVVLSVVMLVVLVVFHRHFIADRPSQKVCLGLMLGGVIGNLMDRVRLGFVVDFLDFFWRDHHFPAFNVADSAICTGVGLYILLQFLGTDHAGHPAPAQSEATRESGATVAPADHPAE